VVLSAGHIEQVGPPMELYHRPANLFVARFIGSPAMNIIPATVDSAGRTTRVTLAGGKSVALDIATDAQAAGSQVSFGVRPEDLETTQGEDFLFEGTVAIVEALGEVTLLYIEGLIDGEPIIAKLPGNHAIARGDKVRFQAASDKLHLFGSDGRTLRT
jgi:alpha-glucoside transport system ATP-binding protein